MYSEELAESVQQYVVQLDVVLWIISWFGS